MVQINYKSDFKITESSETIVSNVPFIFTYYTTKKKKYIASFDGISEYVNCERLEDGSIEVLFNNSNLGRGTLRVERKYCITDEDFKDGIFNVVTDEATDVFLHDGKTYDPNVRTTVVPPYIKGDKGDPMTWSTMTDEERAELVQSAAEAIDPEMVMTENEQIRQSNEQVREANERTREASELLRDEAFQGLKGEMQSAITAGNTAAGNAQKVVDEYDTKVAEQDSKLSQLRSEVVDVESRKQDTIIISNLLNPNDDDYIEGYYIGSKGNLIESGSYAVSGYIPLTKSKSKAILARKGKEENTSGGFVAYYDWDKKFISATMMKDSAVATWFEGVSYVRFSISRYKEGENQIVYGDSIIDYIPFGINYLKDNIKVSSKNMEESSISGKNIAIATLDASKTSFLEYNLLNPNDKDFKEGCHLSSSGSETLSEAFAMSGYIRITQEMPNLILSRNGEENKGGGFICYYDKYKKFIKSQSMIDSAIATWEDGIYYVRFSIRLYAYGDNQINVGTEIFDFIPYGECRLGKRTRVYNNYLENNTLSGEKFLDDSIPSRKLKTQSVTPDKTNFFKKNLFNPNDEDYLPNSFYRNDSGTIGESEWYAISGYIPFNSGQLILSVNGEQETTTNGGWNLYYNKDKEIIGGDYNVNTQQIVTWFEGVAFVRFSIHNPWKGNIQIEYGNEVTSYIPYSENPKIKEEYLPTFNNGGDLIDADNLAKEFSASNSLNLLNPKDCTSGYWIVNSDKTYKLGISETLIASGIIKVKPNTVYSYSKGHSYIPLDKDKKSLVDSAISSGSSTTITTPNNCEYLVISFYRHRDSVVPYQFGHNNRIYEGNILYPYTPYGVNMGDSFHTKNQAQTNSLLGSDGLKIKSESLLSGEELTFTKECYPYSLKGNQICFSAKITDFTGGIQVGRGFTAYNSGYFKITETSVTLIRYEGSESVKKTVEHGLNITNYIKVVISERLDKALLVIQTLGGVFSQEFEYASAYNGQIAAKSLGASLGDVELCASNGSFKHQVWMFGDSYYGADYKNRQLYWLKNWGMLNCLIQSYAGQASTAAYQDLERCMVYGTPKYLVWSLGMNDDNGSDLADITTGNWYKHFVQVKQLCELNGITLICCTIPEVRGDNYKNKDKMSEIVRNSGLRYIDVAKAVGSNSEGQWYGEGTEYDYQATDNVHPSEYGASAIATQFLVDFPEIMQY